MPLLAKLGSCSLSCVKKATARYRYDMTEGKAIEIERKTVEWYAECECFPRSGDAFTTVSGMAIKRLCTPVDITPTRYSEDVGFPGEYPFTPGVHYTGYRGRTLTMRMFAGYASTYCLI